MRQLLDGAGCTTFDGYVTCAHDRRKRTQNMVQMRKIHIGQMQFMVDLESTRQRNVQATNAAQEVTNAAGGH